MEKKTGNLDMKKRRASTAPVLSQNLAKSVSDVYAYSDNIFLFIAQLRLVTHISLPFLLPRSWTLIYSLDQHGISLITYIRDAKKFYRLRKLSIQVQDWVQEVFY